MKTILFDLDGTLLPMEQDSFVKAYFGGLATKLAPLGYEPNKLIQGIWTGTKAMIRNDGQNTNEDVFWKTFSSLYDHDVRKDEPVFDQFYRNEFQFVAMVCGKNPESANLVRFLKEQGCRLILATNPIFPAVGTRSRIKWAGLQEEDFELVTTYENSCYCKPNLQYYRSILQTIGEKPENCIMIGNDVSEDMIAQELGMQVFLLTDCLINKDGLDIQQFPNGSFSDLMEFLKDHIR